MDEQKQVKNLFKKLINDQNSVFYSSGKITKTLLNKGRRSLYEKDKVFYKIFNSIEDKDVIYDFIHPLLNRKKILIDFCHFIALTALYNFFMKTLLTFNFSQKVLLIQNMH